MQTVIGELAMVGDVVLTFKDSLQLVRIADNADHCNSDGRSVCLSVRLSHTFQCFVQRNEDTIVLHNFVIFRYISLELGSKSVDYLEER